MFHGAETLISRTGMGLSHIQWYSLTLKCKWLFVRSGTGYKRCGHKVLITAFIVLIVVFPDWVFEISVEN